MKCAITNERMFVPSSNLIVVMYNKGSATYHIENLYTERSKAKVTRSTYVVSVCHRDL